MRTPDRPGRVSAFGTRPKPPVTLGVLSFARAGTQRDQRGDHERGQGTGGNSVVGLLYVAGVTAVLLGIATTIWVSLVLAATFGVFLCFRVGDEVTPDEP